MTIFRAENKDAQYKLSTVSMQGKRNVRITLIY